MPDLELADDPKVVTLCLLPVKVGIIEGALIFMLQTVRTRMFLTKIFNFVKEQPIYG